MRAYLSRSVSPRAEQAAFEGERRTEQLARLPGGLDLFQSCAARRRHLEVVRHRETHEAGRQGFRSPIAVVAIARLVHRAAWQDDHVASAGRPIRAPDCPSR